MAGLKHEFHAQHERDASGSGRLQHAQSLGIGKAGFCFAGLVAGFGLPALSRRLAQAEEPLRRPLIAYQARIAGDDARTRIVLDFDAKAGVRPFIMSPTPRRASSSISPDGESFGLPDDLRSKPRGLFRISAMARHGRGQRRGDRADGEGGRSRRPLPKVKPDEAARASGWCSTRR